MEEFIGKDNEGNDVFVGSIVEYCWGHCRVGNIYKLHRIQKERKDNTIIYKLGNCYNSWKTSQVVVKSLDIPLEKMYYYEDGTPKLLENKHFFQDDETYDKINKEFYQNLYNQLFKG